MQPLPSNDAIQALLHDRIRQKLSVGIIVGLLDDNGARLISAGISGNPARPEVDDQTLFEIGSITKLFTAAALADAVARGALALDDPLSKFLPLPPDSIGDRTLKQLATHTSGLPRLPSGFAWWSNLLLHPRDPYANYSQHDLQVYLVTLKGKTLPRGVFLYSNLAAGILANVFDTREKTDYATLIAKRVTTPLAMSRTYLHIPPHEQPFLAQPHVKSLRPTPVWTMSALAGAGGLLSSMHDMLLFASAALAATPPLCASMLQPLANAGRSGRSVGLGWMLRTTEHYQVAWHNGGTGGSRSFLGLELNSRRAIVVLSNSAHSVDQLGAQILLGPTLSTNFF
ncbi:MAG: serine hydrolase domain-containing protein [Candidatus Acidiferrum sp.]